MWIDYEKLLTYITFDNIGNFESLNAIQSDQNYFYSISEWKIKLEMSPIL